MIFFSIFSLWRSTDPCIREMQIYASRGSTKICAKILTIFSFPKNHRCASQKQICAFMGSKFVRPQEKKKHHFLRFFLPKKHSAEENRCLHEKYIYASQGGKKWFMKFFFPLLEKHNFSQNQICASTRNKVVFFVETKRNREKESWLFPLSEKHSFASQENKSMPSQEANICFLRKHKLFFVRKKYVCDFFPLQPMRTHA